MKTYSKSTFKKYCDQLRSSHAVIEQLHQRYGYPPFWKRENNFESMCKTIIEQQVSLASANAVFNRLKESCETISPETLKNYSREDFRKHGITTQKARYISLLAERVLQEPDFFKSLQKLANEEAKQRLLELKGVGHWTSNVFMLGALTRLDIYPDFDVALIGSIAYESFVNEKIDNETAKFFIAQFAPMRSIACHYFYHAYIQRKGVVFVP